jgi:hypothetical protein
MITIGYITYLTISRKYYNRLNERFAKVIIDKRLGEKSFLEAMKFNAKYIGDLNISDVHGKSLLLREIKELKNIESKMVVFLRPTDCSICSNELMNLITNRKEDNKYILLTTNENIASVRVLTQKRNVIVSIYCMSLMQASKIMDGVNSGPALFQLDKNCSILNLFIAQNKNKELINNYIDITTK